MRRAGLHTRFAVVAPAALAYALQACTTWEPRTAPVPESLASVHPSARYPVRITLSDGRVLTLTALAVDADSLVGLRTDAPPGVSARVAVPVRAVRSVATRESDPSRTRALVGGVIAGGAALGVGILLLAASAGN